MDLFYKQTSNIISKDLNFLSVGVAKLVDALSSGLSPIKWGESSNLFSDTILKLKNVGSHPRHY